MLFSYKHGSDLSSAAVGPFGRRNPRLRADGWPEGAAPEMASAALALIEGALLLARVSGPR